MSHTQEMGQATSHKSSLYADTITLQKTITSLYILLAMWLFVLVSKVIQVTREAEASAGGDQDALLHNMTATLGLICALLCIASASGMAAHNTAIMAQTMLFQAFVAPGLVFCGGLLYGSGVVIATGAVVGGLVTLVCAYLVRLQRKNEQALQDIYEDDLIASWSQPTPAMHAAVKTVQANFRTHMAVLRMTRAREFDAWLHKCGLQRKIGHALVFAVVALTTLTLAYTNLIFAVTFDTTTCNGWLATCALALLVEAILQQPVILLMTGVLGDFVEESADFLLEVLNN